MDNSLLHNICYTSAAIRHGFRTPSIRVSHSRILFKLLFLTTGFQPPHCANPSASRLRHIKKSARSKTSAPHTTHTEKTYKLIRGNIFVNFIRLPKQQNTTVNLIRHLIDRSICRLIHRLPHYPNLVILYGNLITIFQ